MFSSNTTQESGGYEIQRSLRFNSADSAYLSRTPASASNRKTWTWSGWVKRSLPTAGGIPRMLFGARDSDRTLISFDPSAEAIKIVQEGSSSFSYVSFASYRDFSAWYHIVVAVDTTQATTTNRVKLYVNGQQSEFNNPSFPTQNLDTFINTTFPHTLGSQPTFGDYYNGYMTEINFIDGQALTPSSFGEYNADTGVWQPKRYAGSYGTNGFYLNFSDNSNTTAATLGADYSGNGNNWTPNNFSVSAGAGNDSLVDTPTPYGVDTGVGGEVQGNYCTLNPLTNLGGATLSNGNLEITTPVSGNGVVLGTIAIPVSGKWYFECTPTSSGNFLNFGIRNGSQNVLYFGVTGFKTVDNVETSYGASFTSNDVIAIAVDVDGGSVTFYKNNTSQGSISYSFAGKTLFPVVQDGSDSVGIAANINFGQRPFAYTAPSGFRALNTQNLPTPTIGATPATQAGKFFNPVLYTGTGSSLSVTGVGFQPDWTWIKERNGAADHGLYDVVRGVQNQLESNTTGAETTETTGLTAFGSDGFTVGALAQLNTSADTYVAWNWKANGAGVTNTAGSITSTVSANTTSGFSVVTYAGNSTLGATIGHGLGKAPSMVIVKSRSGTTNWVVYHAAVGNTKALFLNTTSATDTDNFWNNTSPTSTVFSVNASTGLNSSGSNYVAYAFSEVPGYSRFGSYTGNGSSDGPFVFCGFRPAYLMVKRTDTANDWYIIDAVRDGYNVIGPELFANRSDAEALGSTRADFLSNGFKLRSSGPGWNANGGTYIFMAFASAPQKFALAR